MVIRRFQRATVLVCHCRRDLPPRPRCVRLRAQNGAGLGSLPRRRKDRGAANGRHRISWREHARGSRRGRATSSPASCSPSSTTDAGPGPAQPDAPAVARWPVRILRAHRRRIAAREPSLTLPQTVGANFRAPDLATLLRPNPVHSARLERRRRTLAVPGVRHDEVKVLDKAGNAARWMSMTTSSRQRGAAARRCF